jgi:hypothetical protein
MPLYKDVVEFVARTKTFYTPTILVAYGAPWSENYWFENETSSTTRSCASGCRGSCSTAWCGAAPSGSCPRSTGTRSSASRWPTSSRRRRPRGLGSHGQLQGLGAHWETWSLGSGGLTPHETLKVVTLDGAEAIALQQDLGSIEVGKLADLVVLDRQPADRHPPHELGALRDEERRALRRRHARRDLAEQSAPLPNAVLVGHRTVTITRSLSASSGRFTG